MRNDTIIHVLESLGYMYVTTKETKGGLVSYFALTPKSVASRLLDTKYTPENNETVILDTFSLYVSRQNDVPMKSILKNAKIGYDKLVGTSIYPKEYIEKIIDNKKYKLPYDFFDAHYSYMDSQKSNPSILNIGYFFGDVKRMARDNVFFENVNMKELNDMRAHYFVNSIKHSDSTPNKKALISYYANLKMGECVKAYNTAVKVYISPKQSNNSRVK